LTSIIVGSVLLQADYSILHPSSFGRFAEFPVILLYAAGIVSVVFPVIIIPFFAWLRRKHRNISLRLGAFVGLLLGCLSMLLFMLIFSWPIRAPELIAGSLSGVAGTSVYTNLMFKKI